MKPEAVLYAINHIFLPPKLPQEHDGADYSVQRAVLEHLSQCADTFFQQLALEDTEERVQAGWDVLRTTLEQFARLHENPNISKARLEQTINGMREHDVVCLHISAQNAGVVLRRASDHMTLEFFQASPNTALVTRTKGKLVMQFPARPRLALPLDPHCIHSLSLLLAELDASEMREALPLVRKAGSSQVDTREVPDIRFVSELLGGIARGLTPDPDASAAETVFVTKRIGDQALLKSAAAPWRRWPKWLILRVTLQTTLAQFEIPERYGYKAFIAFVLAKTLALASTGDVSHDVLFVMNAKLATRLWKLGPVFDLEAFPPNFPRTPIFPLHFISDQIDSVESILSGRWKEIQSCEASPSTWAVPTSTAIAAAQSFTLPKSSAYFAGVRSRRAELDGEDDKFHASIFDGELNESYVVRRVHYQNPPQPIPSGVSDTDRRFAILDVEQWVANRLDQWSRRTPLPERLLKFKDMIEEHDKLALDYKSQSPEIFSRLFLTILELWVALDKAVTIDLPLLLDYSPELSVESFEPLVLPQLSQMQRLFAVEEHLANRHRLAKYPELSVFKLSTNDSSLPARYFSGSAHLQALQNRISSEASEKRDATLAELQRQNRRHANLRAKAATLPHAEGCDGFRVKKACQSCRLRAEAKSLSIEVFEWPLPEDESLAHLVVFELCVPQSFGIWRDITYGLVQSHSPATPDRPTQRGGPILKAYPGLERYFSPTTPGQRITLASTASSFVPSLCTGFPCEESRVIKNHPLIYQLWEADGGGWLPSTLPAIDIRPQCTPRFSSGPYQSLTWSAAATTHTPNMVIARQGECPIKLSYHEWDAFGHLRAGRRLQWRNMMLQLINGTVDLADPSVHLLFRQAACQVEMASGDCYREAHFDLLEEEFGGQVLAVLTARLNSISENWQEGWTAATLSDIACRLFSLSPSERIKEEAFSFLSRLRQVLFRWVQEILPRLKTHSASELPATGSDLIHRVLQVAASCRSTYALDSKTITRIFSVEGAASVFVQCAIAIQNNIPHDTRALPSALRYLLQRDHFLSTEVVKYHRKEISGNADGLDDAVHSVWEGFSRNHLPWRAVGERWVSCKTPASADSQVRHVYLNILNGSLLVDGKAQGTLPKDILRHSLFLVLFPNQHTLEITPSTMNGMTYQSRHNMDNFEVHFKLRNSRDLLVRIRNRDTGFISEFIPRERLEGDLPKSLLLDNIHIFHEETQSLEICPAPSGWAPRTPAAWCLLFAPDPQHPVLYRNTGDATPEAVLDPNSRIVEGLSKVFQPLETNKLNLLVSLKSQDSIARTQKIHITIPRYNLEFSVSSTSGRVESKELPGFSVSQKQSVGTLIGLVSKLVVDNGQTVKVVVPEGEIRTTHGNLHPTTTIVTSPIAKHLKAFIYDVDDILGRVVGDGTLTSWYLLAYLHIVTSSHLCDPLIHRTGMQQALEMLGSPQSFAFMEMRAEHIDQLQRILDLAPKRHYYPRPFNSMEAVGWHPSLSPLVQSGGFVPLVDAIVDYARQQAVFHPSTDGRDFNVAYKGDKGLRDRAEFRTCRLFSSVSLDQPDSQALPDRCLDCTESSSKERVVKEITTLVSQWPSRLCIAGDLWAYFRSWEAFPVQAAVGIGFDNPRLWLTGDPKAVWFNLFFLCQSASPESRYGLTFALSILAYRGVPLDLVRTLLAIAINTPISPIIHTAVSAFPRGDFNLSHGHILDSADISRVVYEHCSTYEASPQALIPKLPGEHKSDWSTRKQEAFKAQRKSQCGALSNHIFAHWPGPSSPLAVADVTLILPDNTQPRYPLVKIGESLRDAISTLLSRKLSTRRLFERVVPLQRALNTVRSLAPAGAVVSLPPSTPVVVNPPPLYMPITLASLLRATDEILTVPRNHGSVDPAAIPLNTSMGVSASRQLIPRLTRMVIDGPKGQYIDDLSRCIHALEKRGLAEAEPSHNGSYNAANSSAFTAAAQNLLRPKTLLQHLLYQTGQWPSTGPESLLRQLTRELWLVLPAPWKTNLTQYAEGLTAKQKQRRSGSEPRPVQTAETRGSWDPADYPDWLLFQLDADLLIRPVQASIAKEMISPESKKNALLQLNMGEGKSSVIVPIISASLADGEQLVRVVVLKPLSAQMFQLLKQRLCGLVHRRLFYLPFSRDIQLDAAKIEQIVALLKECARIGGILLCQPEHILSFQLMGLHTFCQMQPGSSELRDAQEWLDGAARDILDESDEILSVRYQLIYTVGTPSPLEGQPWRWDIIQEVFSILTEQAATIADVPEGLEIGTVTEPRRFPVTRILTQKGGQALLKSIIKDIVEENRLQQWVSFRNYSVEQKKLISRFLRQLPINPADNRSLQEISGDRYSILLLLRGLFSHGILRLCLQEKRWRVDYGLDPKRSMLAVPYRAKDSPAPRAEFGHPDMIIVLTCLSYYYGGLSDDQLNTSFALLLNSDNPAIRYEHWVNGIDNLPPNLASLRGLNLEDLQQKTCYIFPLLRYNKAVIDFYLSECVFPKEAREFQHKLSTNAWDLARTRERLTTGFSGTNDNKYLLPLSIEQLDQESQRHTNAQVLEYILQDENREVLCTNSDDAMGLLRRLVQQTPSVMVLLDVGAQVLELQNEAVAREWLKLDTRPNIEAAAYFDPSDDEIRVLSRDGRVELFEGSLYRTQLDKTLVYLDEAHTRGTDFKFPSGTRAVVTLGPKLTKDKLVQGCMRMRRLGSDHSLLFFASREIWNKIAQTCIPTPANIDSSDVLIWTMNETITQIGDNAPLWASQGVNFDARRTAHEQHRAQLLLDSAFKDVLKEPESRSLEELYGVEDPSADRSEGDSPLQKLIRRRCIDLGIGASRNSRLLEEQERELAHEKENEREVERIAAAQPREHHIDRRILDFVDIGTVSNSFISLEACLANTSQLSLLPAGEIFRGRKLCATKDFRDTIVLPTTFSTGSMDGYLRGVQWILSSNIKPDVLLLISPFEANALLPDIRKSHTAHLHLYSPRVARNTRSFESLEIFAVPTPRANPPSRASIHELNLFAGQLFLMDRVSMKELCGLLGLYLDTLPPQVASGVVDATGFVHDRAARTTLAIGACSFVSSPLPFMRELFGWRRKGQGFGLTHMGILLNGNKLEDSEFEQAVNAKAGKQLGSRQSTTY
ncbi:hypothetical protein DFH09DRAFT_921131 [Mycena vulgaris]|nr:hypothetical protein DFH09DRAFT_921131 [Mycena vulgaris]